MRHILMVSLNNDPTEELGSLHAGGQTKYIVELGKSLLFHNYSISLITLGEKDKASHHEIVPGFDVYRIHRLGGAPYDYDFDATETFSIVDKCKRLVSSLEKDVVVIFSFYWVSAVLGMELKKYLSVPHVVKFCSLGLYKFTATKDANLCVRIGWERNICSHCDVIIAMTEAEKLTLVEEYGAPDDVVQVIPGGIDLKQFSRQ